MSNSNNMDTTELNASSIASIVDADREKVTEGNKLTADTITNNAMSSTGTVNTNIHVHNKTSTNNNDSMYETNKTQHNNNCNHAIM